MQVIGHCRKGVADSAPRTAPAALWADSEPRTVPATWFGEFRTTDRSSRAARWIQNPGQFQLRCLADSAPRIVPFMRFGKFSTMVSSSYAARRIQDLGQCQLFQSSSTRGFLSITTWWRKPPIQIPATILCTFSFWSNAMCSSALRVCVNVFFTFRNKSLDNFAVLFFNNQLFYLLGFWSVISHSGQFSPTKKY